MKETTAPVPALDKAGGGGPGGPTVRAPDVVAQPALGNRATAGLLEEARPAEAPASPRLLVDGAGEAGRGQMGKDQFLSALRAAVCASVDEGLAGTGRDSSGCPFIEHWLGYYERQDAAHVERALRRYAPEAAGAASARDYIPPVAARVRRSAQAWAETGEISGVPDDVPGLALGGGNALGGLGAFFKARAGGARPTDPAALRDQLGEGRPLPQRVRGRMESAFRASFATVRVHTDGDAARLSDHLNARAFTVGQHVAFGGGEFQPGTIAGDALIAHELAHVVQQGQGRATGGPHEKGGGGADALEHDADLSAAGAVATLWTGARGRLSDVGRQAMPRMRSGLRLQRCAKKQTTPKDVVPGGATKEVKLSPREQRHADLKEANERLREVDGWVSTQKKAQGVPEIGGVTNLDPKQADNVARATELLTKVEAQFDTKAMDVLGPKLDQVLREARDARRLTSSDPDQALTSKGALYRAISASDEATEIVTGLSDRLDVDDVVKAVNTIATTLAGMREGTVDPNDGYDVIDKAVKAAKKSMGELRRRFAKTPEAIGRIRFVLQSFLALNAPALTKAPTAEEMAAFKGKLRGNLSADFSTVFGEGKEIMHGFDAFSAYADVLDRQLAEREKMAKAGGHPASPIPTQGDAETYFATLVKEKNDALFEAYTAYARAFFYHRHVDTLGDLNVSDVAELYARPLSIFGLRPLVCTGYAMLGAHLLRRAGATLTKFIVAVRATDADLKGNRIDAGHAVAVMKRKGQVFFVSNHLIVATEDDAIGPDAVAWTKKDAPLHKASGPTVPQANQNLANALARLIEKM